MSFWRLKSSKKSNIGTDKALIPLETLTFPFISPLTNNLLTQFIKAFLKSIWALEQAKSQEHLLEAKTLETY